MASDERSFCDDWPKLPDNTDYDGKDLLALVRCDNSPFKDVWDVNLLIREVEQNTGARVVDIPTVYNGSNNYGFHLEMSDGRSLLARLSRGDMNMPLCDGFKMDFLLQELLFQVAVYTLLRLEPGIPTSRLLYHRAPVQNDEPRVNIPKDISGRTLMVFERSEGDKNLWRELGSKERGSLLTQAARIRASLFRLDLPSDFAEKWVLPRTFSFMPKVLPLPVAPTREFWVALFASKIEATIGKEGDMIGWESDHNTVGPVALLAKQSLLRFIPHMLPAGPDEPFLYRFVLDHGDFGIHNMSITVDAAGQPDILSLYDWETGCLVPAILSDPEMAVLVDLITDGDGAPAITRVGENETQEYREEYMMHARQYIKAMYGYAPYFERAIQAGKDARHLWFALRAWRGDDPEDFFGKLGAWAERRLDEMGLNGVQ